MFQFQQKLKTCAERLKLRRGNCIPNDQGVLEGFQKHKTAQIAGFSEKELLKELKRKKRDEKQRQKKEAHLQHRLCDAEQAEDSDDPVEFLNKIRMRE
jgi:hypothetical protein